MIHAWVESDTCIYERNKINKLHAFQSFSSKIDWRVMNRSFSKCHATSTTEQRNMSSNLEPHQWWASSATTKPPEGSSHDPVTPLPQLQTVEGVSAVSWSKPFQGMVFLSQPSNHAWFVSMGMLVYTARKKEGRKEGKKPEGRKERRGKEGMKEEGRRKWEGKVGRKRRMGGPKCGPRPWP